VKQQKHPMDMLRDELAVVIQRWAQEADMEFFEVMYVLEELKMEVMFQNIERIDEDGDGIYN
jgi:hypothetical protein